MKTGTNSFGIIKIATRVLLLLCGKTTLPQKTKLPNEPIYDNLQAAVKQRLVTNRWAGAAKNEPILHLIDDQK